MNIPELGERLTDAGRLKLDVLAVCITLGDERAVQMGEVDRCVAKALYLLARGEAPPLKVDRMATSGICPGALGWLGLSEPPEKLKYFVSYGTPDFRGGRAEFLKGSPELVDECRRRIGTISFPEGTMVVMPCSLVKEEKVLSIICFADALGARNLCSLAHFGSDDPAGTVLAPWGPMCTSLISYPAGMAQNISPAIILGSMDPTVNTWFPGDHLSLGIPLELATRMADDLERSFIVKRPAVAYPLR